MPTVNKLTGKGNTPATPPVKAPKSTAPVKAPAAKSTAKAPKSPPVNSKVTVLPADTRALQKSASGIKVPAFLLKSTMPETASGNTQGGYVGFADPQSKKWSAMEVAGLKHGDPFVFIEGQYTRCNPLHYFLLMGDSFRTTMVGQQGDFTYATRDLESPLRDLAEAVEGDDQKARIRKAGALKCEPHYTCLLLALIGGETLVPVRADFRGTKADAGESAITAVKSAEDAEWIRLSEAHKVTAAFPHPWGRVFCTVTTKYKVGRSSGNGFFVANCAAKPASVDQMQALVTAFSDDDFLAKLEEAETAYLNRINFLDRICAGEPAEETDPATGKPRADNAF